MMYIYIRLYTYIPTCSPQFQRSPGALRGGRHTPALRPGLGRRSLRQGAAPAAPAREKKWDVMVIP